ncbi:MULTISPECIES: class I adenylate-forming enzyme family protein [unclassified Tolypothrix]|uniref:class I adenylate-forming enzyme family protein n=1 Tax=unclassified Tolypothrix TaxID=2649714 RepID=UPI0005EAAC9D|nr:MULTISPECIES: AMP-binding protein [unclassified Tolypothrix]EKE97758.1 CoA ligase domain protein [Tolypothrix sp. PCC 7601]MBE9084510.1 AMP-binding protein [Tolypothrix sp. LEGE 11397]UYD23555.1 AMP-binding protein [Tolypothrix sp. PCC 7712]UYD34217.1 AMP-binding protein [Tolypothrix sp. PCC 7601]
MPFGFTQIFGVEILEGCGMTEVIPYSMNPNDAKRLGSIGKATEGMMLRIVNENGEDVPQGEIGEIIVKSEAMMLGYWNQPEATAAVLQDGWLYTGDLAWMDADNYYWFVSRRKEIIVRGGSNISPLEVEAVLYQHPSVKEAAVIGVPNANCGEIVQAFVVLKAGYAISKIELKEFMSDRIAALYRVIHRTYLQPAPTQETAAELLDLPFSTYRRHLKAGMTRIAEILWQREIS